MKGGTPSKGKSNAQESDSDWVQKRRQTVTSLQKSLNRLWASHGQSEVEHIDAQETWPGLLRRVMQVRWLSAERLLVTTNCRPEDPNEIDTANQREKRQAWKGLQQALSMGALTYMLGRMRYVQETGHNTVSSSPATEKMETLETQQQSGSQKEIVQNDKSEKEAAKSASVLMAQTKQQLGSQKEVGQKADKKGEKAAESASVLLAQTSVDPGVTSPEVTPSEHIVKKLEGPRRWKDMVGKTQLNPRLTSGFHHLNQRHQHDGDAPEDKEFVPRSPRPQSPSKIPTPRLTVPTQDLDDTGSISSRISSPRSMAKPMPKPPASKVSLSPKQKREKERQQRLTATDQMLQSMDSDLDSLQKND